MFCIYDKDVFCGRNIIIQTNLALQKYGIQRDKN